jgi:uncharacterized protein YjbI with pentapeptide repeats
MEKVFQETGYDDETFINISLDEQTLSGVSFDYCTFNNCSFNKTIFKDCRFTECIFESCNLSLVNIKTSIFNDIKLLNSKAIGINWSSIGLPFEIKFENTDISMSSFYSLDLRRIQIINSKVNDVDFTRTNLEKANFKKSDLLGSSFSDTNLKNADLSQALNYTINPNRNILKGTKVSLPEASSFLTYFDLKII